MQYNERKDTDGVAPPTRVPRIQSILLVASVLAAAAGCKGGSSTTSPSSTGTPASPTTSEVFSGTLSVGGTAFYSFSLPVYGTVNATLLNIGGPGVPTSVMVNLGIGTPAGTSCNTPAATRVQAGTSTALVTASEQPGLYCVAVSDIGNLFGPAGFSVQIDNP